jgi:hypothetical protein
MRADYENKPGDDGLPGQDRLALSLREIGTFERTLVRLAGLKILLFPSLLKGEMAR